MNRDLCLQSADQYFTSGRLFSELAERVSVRTESDGGEPNPALSAYLQNQLEPSLRAMGFETRCYPNPVAGHGPFLLAHRVESEHLPGVLMYGHGDVVNGHEGRWAEGRSPWQLSAAGDRWYGRGTADNKGQHTINLAALAHTISARQGRLGYNVTLLFEMGEEAASPGLTSFCQQYQDLLRADVFLASDGPRVSAEQPTVFLGSRGAVNFSLRVRSRTRPYHSGNWGGVLTNPATVLSHALASLVDARGRILVEALRPAGIDPAVRAALACIPVGDDADAPALNPNWGEPGLSPAEKLFGWNTLEILAVGAGDPQQPVNAIPAQAVAHCQLRFVVGTPWEQVQTLVEQHLHARGFENIEVTTTLAGAATRLNVEHPWVRWAARSIQHTTGKAPHILPNLAGSLPNDVFATTLGLPTLWVPHSYAGCAQHAPNEHLLAPLVLEGLQIMAGLFWDLGEPEGLPWHSTPTPSYTICS